MHIRITNFNTNLLNSEASDQFIKIDGNQKLNGDDNNLSKGAIMGIIIGVVIFAILLSMVMLKLFYTVMRCDNKYSNSLSKRCLPSFLGSSSKNVVNAIPYHTEKPRSYSFYNAKKNTAISCDINKEESVLEYYQNNTITINIISPMLPNNKKSKSLSFRPICLSLFIRSSSGTTFEQELLNNPIFHDNLQPPQKLLTKQDAIGCTKKSSLLLTKQLVACNIPDARPLTRSSSLSKNILRPSQLFKERLRTSLSSETVGKKSVNSVQWVGFNDTMDTNYKQTQPLDVINSSFHSNVITVN